MVRGLSIIYSDPSAHPSEGGIHGSEIDNVAGDAMGGVENGGTKYPQFRGGEHVEWDRLVKDSGINNKSLYKYARMQPNTECHVDGTGRGGLPEDYGISRGY